jgi:FkbM family methyltransferase
MAATIQKVLLAIYRLVHKTGVLQQPWCQTVFLYSYFFYKKHLEDPFRGLVDRRPDLFKGGHILDIGANIGYTSSLFASSIDPQFKVHSFEPDASNFAMLQRFIERDRKGEIIVANCTAVGSSDGAIDFWHNPDHHGDHRVLTPSLKKTGVPAAQVSSVPVITIDSYVNANRIENQIRFVKIDVQGYELQVCKGMLSTMERNPDLVIALEYAPEAMRALGANPDQLLDFFRERDWLIYLLDRHGNVSEFSKRSAASFFASRDYVDLLICKDVMR